MAKRKRKKTEIVGPGQRDSYGVKYRESIPMCDSKDFKVILSKPIETSVHAKSNPNTHLQIVNGVVCSTGRYTRLYEDYDDK